MKLRILPQGLLKESKKRKKILFKDTTFTKKVISSIPALWLLLFFVFPLLIIFKISFSKAVFDMPPFSEIFYNLGNYMLEVKICLQNYVKILRDYYYLKALINSLTLGVSAVIFCLMIGYPMAYGIYNAKQNIKTVLLLLVTLSFWTSSLIRVYSWINFLSIHGTLNSALMNIGIINEPIQFLGTYPIVCLGMVGCYLPFMIFPIYAILERVDRSYIEAALDLGYKPTKVFWTITIPLTKQGIISGSLLVFATSAGEFVVPELLGGANTITLGRILWSEFFSNLDWPMACALSIFMMVIVVLPVLIMQKKTT